MPVIRDEFLLLWKHSKAGHEVKVRELIEEFNAVALNLVNQKHYRKGTTPLMEAAACRCGGPVVAKLISAGADVNDVDDTKLKGTALHYAAMTNRNSIVTEILLEAGADAYAVNRMGHTPLDVARQYGRKEVGAVLLNHMKVYAGWLYLRGRFCWRRRWVVVVACNKQQTSTELCIFRHPGKLRPELVMLIDEAARMTHFSSTDTYSWLKRDNAFVFDKPVMCHRVRRHKFTRSPICKKTMSLEDVQTQHFTFATDKLSDLAQWHRVMQKSNFRPCEDDSSFFKTSLVDTQKGECYYWPHELVESLRTSILKEQDQERDIANDSLYQRLRATFQQRQSVAASSVLDEQAQEQPEAPTRPSSYEESIEEVPSQNYQMQVSYGPRIDQSGALLKRDKDKRNSSAMQPVKYIEVPSIAQQSYMDGEETNSSISIFSESESESAGSEYATEILLLSDNNSCASSMEGQEDTEQVNIQNY